MRLLFEIGVEELPSRYVNYASKSLLEIIKNKLKENRIEFENAKDFNSPRRIAVYFENIAEKQKDFNEKKIGPAVNVAFKDNKLTLAALGFLKGQSMKEEDLLIEKGEKFEYIYVNKSLKGLDTKDIIADILKDSIKMLDFDKSMKWGEKSFRFARPIKWILATLDDKIIDFEFEGIKTSNLTRGMRIFGKDNIEIIDSSKYEEKLLENYVIVDYEKRKDAILKSIKENCETLNQKVVINKKLLDEVVNLVEYPYAIKGKFNESYLKLPEQIITITMETHQRYFPIIDENSKLTNNFVIVRNAPEYSELVKLGNEKVIEPRLSDAKFFYDEDLKINLEDNIEKLKTVLFQKNMGSIYDKIQRNKKIATYIIDKLNKNNLEVDILRAIDLSKADLVSNVINEKEFTKLQGFMGSIYAKNSNEKENVSKAIFEHYLPRYQGDILPTSIEGSISSIADKFDTLVGCFSVNLIPSSSKDPYALRRATQGIIQIILNAKFNLDYKELLTKVYEIFSISKEVLNNNALDNVIDFFKQRLVNILQEKYDKTLINYLIDIEYDLVKLEEKLSKLKELSKTENFEIMINLIKRLKNISKSTDIKLDTNLLLKDEEKAMYDMSLKLDSNFDSLKILLDDKDVIDSFFTNIKINDDDENIRNNRLALINTIMLKIEKIINI